MNDNKEPVEELRVLNLWTEFLEWLLPTTDKFPKKARFSLTSRIDNLALEMVERLVEARFTRQRRPLIRQANLTLDKLRVLLRIAHRLQFLPHRQYEHANRAMDEFGRLLGAWGKASA